MPLSNAVTTFSTASRAHLRRATPDGADRLRELARATGESRAAGVTAVRSGKGRRGSRRCRAAAFAAPFGRKPYGATSCRARLPRHRPQRSPPSRPAAVPARAGPGRRAHAECADRRAKRSQPPGRNAAHCPGRPLQRQGHPKILSNRFAESDLRDPPLSAGASADPAGLTARARPEARPDKRAANLHKPTYRKDEAEGSGPPTARRQAALLSASGPNSCPSGVVRRRSGW